jgi:hypothetical protein
MHILRNSMNLNAADFYSAAENRSATAALAPNESLLTKWPGFRPARCTAVLKS